MRLCSAQTSVNERRSKIENEDDDENEDDWGGDGGGIPIKPQHPLHVTTAQSLNGALLPLCLEALPCEAIPIDRIHPGKEMVGRIVAMLTRLVDRFDVDESRALALD